MRRNIIIKGSFQLRFAVLVVGVCVLLLCIILFDGYLTIGKSLEKYSVDPEFMYLMSQASISMGIKIILYLIVLFCYSFFISHRIVGPIYRFERTLRSFSEGNLSVRVRLRTRDEFRDLQEQINRSGGILQAKINRIRQLTHTNSSNRVIRDELEKQFKING